MVFSIPDGSHCLGSFLGQFELFLCGTSTFSSDQAGNVLFFGANFGVSRMIITLRPTEHVQLDRNRLTEIIARLGSRGADELISRVMEELATQLAKAHNALGRGSFQDAQSAALIISEVADHIGMPLLSDVARHMAQLVNTDDGAALAATAARLSRIGEASLLKVWELQDLSM